MKLPTTIASKSKGTILIADMVTPHLLRTIAQYEREGRTAEPVYEALKVEASKPERQAPDPTNAGPTVDAARGAHDAPNPRAEIGGNAPPPMAIIIATDETNAGLKVELDRLLKTADAIPAQITTPAHHDMAVKLGTTAKALSERIKDRHVVVKAPYKEGADAADQFFLTKGLMGKLTTTANMISMRDGAYLAELDRQAREAARQEQARADKIARQLTEQATEAEQAGEHTRAEVKLDSAVAHEQHAERLQTTVAAPMGSLGRTYSEAGSASAKVTVEPTVDHATVDLEALRQFISTDALVAAAKALSKARGWKGADLIAEGTMPARYGVKGVTWAKVTKAAYR